MSALSEAEAEPPTLFELIEKAVRDAQDLSLPPTPEPEAVRLRDVLIPGLHQARLYVEVGRLRDPEVRGGLLSALREAQSLADASRRYDELVNRLRILVEEADIAAREY